MFAFQFDRLVVSRDFTSALYAVYAIGAVELPLSVIVQQAVNAVLVPAMTRHYAAGDMPGLTALWKRAIRRTSLVLFPTFVFFMLTARGDRPDPLRRRLSPERRRVSHLPVPGAAAGRNLRDHHPGDRTRRA